MQEWYKTFEYFKHLFHVRCSPFPVENFALFLKMPNTKLTVPRLYLQTTWLRKAATVELMFGTLSRCKQITFQALGSTGAFAGSDVGVPAAASAGRSSGLFAGGRLFWG